MEFFATQNVATIASNWPVIIHEIIVKNNSRVDEGMLQMLTIFYNTM